MKHVYFVAETKGSMSTMALRSIEGRKIECARKFFKQLNAVISPENVKYDVVTDYGKLMGLVGSSASLEAELLMPKDELLGEIS